MTPRNIFILLLALFATSIAQSDNDLHIPEENDNQFPPVIHTEPDLSPIEGSGEEELLETSTGNVESPLLDNVQLSSTLLHNENIPTSNEHTCPTKCICNIEGLSDKYVVDCSDAGLTELPTPLDVETTELNLENNKLTIIPKDVAVLKNLKILNAKNNEIMDIAAGSISELPELISLKLTNNRLIEYPKDLKNSFGLTKLEEFDLGGNDMRTVLKSETFSMFKALRKLTLPSANSELVDEVCAALKESLQTVCTESCNNNTYDCPDAPDAADDLDIAIPAIIPSLPDLVENEDLITSTDSDVNNKTESEQSIQSSASNVDATIASTNVETTIATANEETTTASITVKSMQDSNNDAASFHSAVIKATGEESKPTQVETNQDKVEIPTETVQQSAAPGLNSRAAAPIELEPKITKEEASHTDASQNSNIISKSEGKVAGSTTAHAKTGGVDKSIIGIIVAGMVVVVAGITIKKNWSSIKNRFSSTPRTANGRTGISSNGTATAPEEMPLQEKSPV